MTTLIAVSLYYYYTGCALSLLTFFALLNYTIKNKKKDERI